MKLKAQILFLFLSFLFINCKNESVKTTTSKQENKKQEIVNEEKQETKIANEDFETFLKEFSRDSIFQVSRVKFPLKTTETNFESTEEKIISKSEYKKMDFTYPEDAATRQLDAYTQKNVLKNNLMIVEIRGVDNGIYTDIIFEKINGRWFLKTLNDLSN
ncbi:DUF4348 domain-containing protein [Flavobacterium hungaricum]|uniref:DUF4348 domain-containing protein n=1 Tax=Flavobacterium hungaricum TaxID=2082725 RepID=A0ABR9TE56_9FLAO|nr:DUF4348 domain-containing protein [Flavobacterium hungaricum]MBE8723618.1 DUF4348 domain-containing protein [Flavobacterium hungaricum]